MTSSQITAAPQPTTGIDRALSVGIIPVVVINGEADAERLGAALLVGRLPVAEVTLRTPGALAAIKRLAEEPSLAVGAGTVLDEAQYDAAVEAGATYVVSPGSTPSLFRAAERTGVPLLPGAVTATEIMRARDEGYNLLKFFPAESSGGAAAVKSFASTFAGIDFVPTGGIGLGNLRDYLQLGNIRAVGGSWMVPPKLLADPQGATKLQALIADAVSASEAAARSSL